MTKQYDYKILQGTVHNNTHEDHMTLDALRIEVCFKLQYVSYYAFIRRVFCKSLQSDIG